jgi:hypothetical protein
MGFVNDLYQVTVRMLSGFNSVTYLVLLSLKPFSMRNYVAWLLLFFSIQVSAQQQFVLVPKESRLIISGTSSLHAWQCRAEQPTGKMSAALDNQTLSDIPSLTLSVSVTSIKSIGEKGEYYDKNMDKNVYRALNAEKYPTITFSLNQFSKKLPSPQSTTIEATGLLRINGVAREVILSGICTTTANGLTIEGKVPLKMRDYNVEPPTAIFGTIKTGNEITIDYKLVYRLLPVK